MKKTISLLALICIVTLFFAGCQVKKTENQVVKSDNVLLEHYKKIELGMSIDDAINIIGRPPEDVPYGTYGWLYDTVWKDDDGFIGLVTHGYDEDGSLLDSPVIVFASWQAADNDWHSVAPNSVEAAYTDFLSLEIGMSFEEVAQVLGYEAISYAMEKNKTGIWEGYSCIFGYLSFRNGLLSWKYFVWASYFNYPVIERPENWDTLTADIMGITYEETCSLFGVEGVLTGVGKGDGFDLNTYCWWFSSSEDAIQDSVHELHFWNDALGSSLRVYFPGIQEVALNSD